MPPLLLPLHHQITESFSYLPFGGGRRKCIGDQFALFETLVALASLCEELSCIESVASWATGCALPEAPRRGHGI